jgi:hypothetical protein
MTSENTGWEPFDPSSGGVPESLLSILPRDEERGAVVVTAAASNAEDGDWPALVALRVAELWGGDGDPAMLIDLGLEAPTLHAALAEPPGEGISDVFLFSASLRRVSRMVREGAVRLVQAGTVAGDPARLRSHRAWSKLLGREIARGTNVVLHVPLGVGGSEDIVALADTLVLMGAPGDLEPGFVRDFPGTVVRLAPPTEAATVDHPAEPKPWGEESGDAAVFTGFGDDEVDVAGEHSTRDEGLRPDDESPQTDGAEHEHPAWPAADAAEIAEPGIIVIDTLAPELHATMEAVAQTPVAAAPAETPVAEDSGEALDVEFAEQSSAVIDAVFSESVPEPEEPAAVGEEQGEGQVESPDHGSEPAAPWTEAPDEYDESAYPWEDRGDRRAEDGEAVEETQDASLDPFQSDAESDELGADRDLDEDLAAEAAESDAERPVFDLDSVPNPFARPFSRDDVDGDTGWDASPDQEFDSLPDVKDRRGSRKSFLRVAATVAVVVIGAGAIGLTTVRPTDDPEFNGGVRPGTASPAAAPGALAADPEIADPLNTLSGGDSGQTGETPPSDLLAAAAALTRSNQGDSETGTMVDGRPGPTAGEGTPDEGSSPASGEPTEAKAAADPQAADQGTPRSDRAADADAPTSTQTPSPAATEPSPDPTPSAGATAPDRADPSPTPERTREADPTPDSGADEPDPAETQAGSASRAAEPPPETPAPTVAPAARTPADARSAEEAPARPAVDEPDPSAEEASDQPAASAPAEEPPVAEATAPGPGEGTTAEPTTPPPPTATARDEMTAPPPSTRPSGLMAYGLEVGSHGRLAAARAQASSLQAQFPHLEFIEVPVRVDGALVYRVMAGPAATASEAEGLRTSLTGFLGRAASSSATVRSTGLTFLLGAFEDYPEAKGRAATARERGVPAYLAEFPVSGDRMVYRVYAGAFGNETEAAALGSLLADAELGMTPLIERMGRPTR